MSDAIKIHADVVQFDELSCGVINNTTNVPIQFAIYNKDNGKWRYVTSDDYKLRDNIDPGRYLVKARTQGDQSYGEWSIAKTILVTKSSDEFNDTNERVGLLNKYFPELKDPTDPKFKSIFRKLEGGQYGLIRFGPTDSFSHVFPAPAAPWRRGNRPRITFPFQNIIQNSLKVVEWTYDPDEEGHFEVSLIVEQQDKNCVAYFKWIVSSDQRRLETDLSPTVIETASIKIFLCFVASVSRERRYAWQCGIRLERSYSGNLNTLMPHRTDTDRDLREAFYENLKSSDYDKNQNLRDSEAQSYQTILSCAPTYMHLSLGQICNINCIMCSTGRNVDRTDVPGKVMQELTLILTFLDRVMVQGGEPLMFKSFRNFLSLAKDFPLLTVSIGTNGLLLKQGWLDQILDSRVDLKLSLDAINAETYGKIRRKGNWDDILYALQYIRDNKKSEYPAVTLAFCVMRSNYREIVDFILFANKYKCKSVYFVLMEPRELDLGYEDEYILEDEEVCREIVVLLKEVHRIGKELNITVWDKVLGWILPRYPKFCTEQSDLDILDPNQRHQVDIEANALAESHIRSKIRILQSINYEDVASSTMDLDSPNIWPTSRSIGRYTRTCSS
jgi:molybdenum cofactor biosynthesis enzyme MoaA